MFSSPAKQKQKCGKLLADWQQCFERELGGSGDSDSTTAAAATKAAAHKQKALEKDLATAKGRMCSVK